MSFTRFHDDECRIEKQLQEQSDPGRYMLNVPGPGDDLCFMEDPFIRMQKWGTNLRTNTINLESDLRGLTRSLTHDCNGLNNYEVHRANSTALTYGSCQPITDQSRATHPAWEYRDLEQNNRYILPLNPQENTCIPFQNNLSSRILEKDYFVTHNPCLSTGDNSPMYIAPFSGLVATNQNQSCMQSNNCNKI